AELRAHGPAPYAVVASMGENDEHAVIAALATRPAYVGVVASRTRFAVLRETLLGRGVAAQALDAIRNPAGLDIGGRLPEELALSILAEIVQLRRTAQLGAADIAPAVQPVAEDIDPVCGMTVAVATARHTGEWNGRTWYFCNARCKEAFLAGPHRYVDAATSGAGR